MFITRASAAVFPMVGALFLVGANDAGAQVVAEPAMLAARVPPGETFQAYLAFPENSFVIAGMLRFGVSRDVDIGGRAGLWLIDGASDTPFAGADVRYGLLDRPLDPGGAHLALSLDFGVGVSDPGPTIWRFPVGIIAGFGFGLGSGDAEVYVHPRFEFGISSGDPDTDTALHLDLGALFPIVRRMSADIGLRFGNGLFGEGDQVVVGIGALWKL